MHLIVRQLRNHRVRFCICILLLIGEAAMCLASPVLLGRLIHTGLERSGYADDCPKVLSPDAAALFEQILPARQRQRFRSLYAPDDDPAARFTEAYACERECLCLRASADQNEAVTLYRNAVFSAVLALRETDGYASLDYRDLIDRFSKTAIQIGRETVSFPEAEKEAYYAQAAKTALPLKVHAADFLLPYLYADAGLNCDAQRSRFTVSVCVTLSVCLALQCLCALVSAWEISRISCAVELDLRRSLLTRTADCTREDLRRFSSSFLSDTVQNGVRQIGMSLQYGVRLVFYSASVAVAGCMYCFRANFWFGVLVLAGSAVILLALWIVYRVGSPRYARMQTRYAQYSRAVRTNLRQALTIRSLAADETEKQTVAEHSAQICADERFISGAVGFAFSFSGLLVNLLTGLLALVGFRFLPRSDLTVGTIVAGFQIALITVGALMALEAAVVFAPRAIAAARSIRDVLGAEYFCDAFRGNTAVPDGVHEITFRACRAVPQCDAVSFSAVRGQIVGLTGPTAVGKTALMRALVREQALLAGEILVDQADIRTFSADYPGAFVSRAESNPMLFTGTIRENMRLYGAAEDPSRMHAVLKACACDFLPTDGDVLDVYLENGGETLSGGQRSRLALACALSKKANIYILDDCLSAVDPATRTGILRRLRSYASDAVILLVTQEAGDLAAADAVVSLRAPTGTPDNREGYDG